MVTTINGSQVSGLQQGMAGNAKLSINNSETETSAQQADTENAYATSDDGDTLTLSASATFRARTFTGQSQLDSTSSDEGYTDSTAEALKQAASSAGIDSTTQLKNEMNADSAAVSGAGSAGSSASGSSSSSETSLSNYTESELKEMLQDGEITQAEYNAEIKSREDDTTDSEEEEDETNAANTTTVEVQ